jgi:hypothetical protein
MVIYKHGCKLSKKEKEQILSLVSEIGDIYGDFYLTKNNLRLFIADNIDILFSDIEKGDYIAFDENGVAILTGFSDRGKRKYLKVLTKTPKYVEQYLRIFEWDLSQQDLFIKIKKNNPIRDILIKNNFEFFGGRGKEVLLIKKGKENVRRPKIKD